MQRAFLFPGQGSQFVGMAREAYINSGPVRDILDRANGVLGYELTGIMFEGEEEELRQTQNAQPAIFLHSYALYQQIDDPRPVMAAGHSLGEYTALTVANAITFEEALKLVHLRATAMQSAGDASPGTMAAIVGLDDDVVELLCREASERSGIVVPANFNSPGQIVVSGTPLGVATAMELAQQRGARLVRELNVSGAFHSPLMEAARQQLAGAIAVAGIRDAEFPVYTNITGAPIQKAEAIRASLLEQLASPVYWTRTIQCMADDGASEFVEVGPGNVLRGLLKRILPGSQAIGVANPADVAEINQTHP